MSLKNLSVIILTGSLSADEDESDYSTYEILSDTSLRGYRFVSNDESGKSDSTSWLILPN